MATRWSSDNAAMTAGGPGMSSLSGSTGGLPIWAIAAVFASGTWRWTTSRASIARDGVVERQLRARSRQRRVGAFDGVADGSRQRSRGVLSRHHPSAEHEVKASMVAAPRRAAVVNMVMVSSA